MFQTKYVQETETYVLRSTTSFSENRAVYQMWKKKKYCTVRQGTHDNMTHAHYMLDN